MSQQAGNLCTWHSLSLFFTSPLVSILKSLLLEILYLLYRNVVICISLEGVSVSPHVRMQLPCCVILATMRDIFSIYLHIVSIFMIDLESLSFIYLLVLKLYSLCEK